MQQKKHNTAIYAREFLQPKLIWQDDKGRTLIIEVTLEGKKVVVANIYALNDAQEKYFERLYQKQP